MDENLLSGSADGKAIEAESSFSPPFADAESWLSAIGTDEQLSRGLPSSWDHGLHPDCNIEDVNPFILLILSAVLIAVSLLLMFIGSKIKYRTPSYWKHGHTRVSDKYYEEVDVTATMREPVQRLFDCTCDPSKMGVGMDGKWATHKGFRVIKVTRIENGRQWTDYCYECSRILRTKVLIDEMLKYGTIGAQFAQYTAATLAKIDGRFRDLERDPQVKRLLDSLALNKSKNERLLFHGSPGKGAIDHRTGFHFDKEEHSPAYAIKHIGFDERLGNVKGMYGAGTYFGDMCSKADQYAGRYHPPGVCTIGEQATLFLSRVTLGCPYRTTQSLEQLKRPPCILGEWDLTLFWNMEVQLGRPWHEKFQPQYFNVCQHPRFDSVMADLEVDNMPRLYREYIVYSGQAYPEFCVTYERI